MSRVWYVIKDEKQLGPYTWEQLWHQARSGALAPADQVWSEGMDGWRQADQFPGLMNIPGFVTTPPPPPAPALVAGKPEAKAHGKKGMAMSPAALILGLVLLVAVAGGTTYYFFFQDRGLPTAEVDQKPGEQGSTSQPHTEDEPDSESVLPEEQPGAVVEAFIWATLGTVPGAAVDYDKARSLMTADYATAFDTPEFVPHTYNIQDGPRAYEIADGYLEGSSMKLIVWGFWNDETAMRWLFILEQEDGAWKIDAIEVMEPDGEAAESPFWQLNPVTTEFTVYPNGGWKLVVEFDRPQEDIGANLKVAYYRADDGTVAYEQEMIGVISAGHGRLSLNSDYSGYNLYNLGFKAGMHQVIAYIDGIEIASGELNVP